MTTSSSAGLLGYVLILSFLTSVLCCVCPPGVGRTQSFSAHEDDDLLFMSPNLMHDVVNGRCVQTVYVTAGNNNQGEEYWGQREEGEKAAYAAMLGVSNSWTLSDAGISGHPTPMFTLTAAPRISLVFMRLPDGQTDGQGGDNFNDESLSKLWNGDIDIMHTVDRRSTYTRNDLLNSLLQLMMTFQPDAINVLDYTGDFTDDHPDHVASATFARTAHQSYTTRHTLTAYQGYGIADRPVNINTTDIATKRRIFLVYSQYDKDTCQTAQECSGSVANWWNRQYIVAQEVGGTPAPTTPAPTTSTPTTPGPTSGSTTAAPTTAVPTGNVALVATATASSQNTNTQQTANKAIDGVIAGYPGDYTKEWATNGGHAGSWLKLTWSTPVTLRSVVLYDRPNLDDQVTAGTLTFSDGTIESVGALNNAGAAVTVTLSTPKTTTSLLFTITQVKSSTLNIGLAEIQAIA